MSAVLLQFKAGRAERQGDSNTVVPQAGRGLVYLQEEDGLMHFYYKDLESNAVVDDLIIFPGDATFEPATDRVHVLKFSSSSARHFYWHQDVDLPADEFARRGRTVNELIGAEDVAPAAAAAMDVEAPAASDDVFMSSAPSTSSAPRAAPTADAALPAGNAALGNAAQLAQLQSILAGLGGGAGGTSSGVPEFTLPDVLPPSTASSLLASLPHSSLSLLSSFLPPSPLLPTSTPAETRASLARALQSPEYRRALGSLDRALRTGATGPLVQGLGLPERAAQGTREFLEEVQRKADEEREREGREGGQGGSA
ncbi:hypothetical protein JCM10450v2_007840 [Rhodotorula kratochvilovae]